MTPTQAAMVARCWTNLTLSARLPAANLDVLCAEFAIYRAPGEADESMIDRLRMILPAHIAIEDLLDFVFPSFVPRDARW
ncbi:MAG: hypothetical protein ABW167_07855 [Baekduia sp.]